MDVSPSLKRFTESLAKNRIFMCRMGRAKDVLSKNVDVLQILHTLHALSARLQTFKLSEELVRAKNNTTCLHAKTWSAIALLLFEKHLFFRLEYFQVVLALQADVYFLIHLVSIVDLRTIQDSSSLGRKTNQTVLFFSAGIAVYFFTPI